MHAVFVLPRFFPYRGGYENSLLALSRHLVQRGHRVTVFTTVANDLESLWVPGFKTYAAGEEAVDGIRVCRFPIDYNRLRRRATRLLGAVPYWRWKAQYWRPSFRVPGLAEALGSIDADLFHIGPLPYTNLMYAGLRAAEIRDVPVVATPCTHLGEEGSDEVSRHYVQSYQLELLKRCAMVFCMTNSERRGLEQRGVSAPMTVMPYGIDVAAVSGGNPDYLRQKYNVQGPVVLHLGMKAYDKGSVTLIEAMQRLWAGGSEAWLVMAGPSMSAFDEYVRAQAPGCPRLLNLPSFEEPEKRDLLASATIVAQPSRVESLGLVLLEAWANGKPVIAADIAVSRELVTSCKGGTVVPFGNSDELGDWIQLLLKSDTVRAAMASGCEQMARQYDGAAIWRRTSEELERIVAASRAAKGTKKEN